MCTVSFHQINLFLLRVLPCWLLLPLLGQFKLLRLYVCVSSWVYLNGRWWSGIQANCTEACAFYHIKFWRCPDISWFLQSLSFIFRATPSVNIFIWFSPKGMKEDIEQSSSHHPTHCTGTRAVAEEKEILILNSIPVNSFLVLHSPILLLMFLFTPFLVAWLLQGSSLWE